MNRKKLYITLTGASLLLLSGLVWWNAQRTSPKWAIPLGLPPVEAYTLNFKGQDFDIVKIDPLEHEVRLFWKDPDGQAYESFEALGTTLEAEGKFLRFATNAGIFSEDHTPGGLHVENGAVFKSLNLRDGGGNFHMKPNGVFILGTEGAGVMESEAFTQENLQLQLATQSGPMLVIDGHLHPDFREGSSNKHIRNGVGVDQDGDIVFVISNERVNFYDFASLFRDALHCLDALYLDGSISEFYSPDLGRTDAGGGFCGILAVVD